MMIKAKSLSHDQFKSLAGDLERLAEHHACKGVDPHSFHYELVEMCVGWLATNGVPTDKLNAYLTEVVVVLEKLLHLKPVTVQ